MTLPDFCNARILVVGDVMLDRYFSGATQRISPEAPVPILHVQKSEDLPGGAGNAAGDGDVVAVANTTVAITCVDDINIGSYLDFHCAVDAAWIVSGELIVDAVGSVPTLA